MRLKDVLTGIADTIREYEEALGTYGGLDPDYEAIPMKLEEMADKIRWIVEEAKKDYRKYGYDAGYREGKEEGIASGTAAGKQAEYDRFWDTFQEKGKRKTYNHAFYVPHTSYAAALPCWNDDTFRPKYPIICRAGNGGDYMLTFSMVTRISVRIEVYRYDSQTEKLLYNNPYLETVEELWVQDGCTFNNWFTNDVALKNITFADGSVISSSISFADSPDLTDASTQSIVNAFADRSGKPAITLTVHKKVGERMPAAQKAALAAKNVTLAY